MLRIKKRSLVLLLLMLASSISQAAQWTGNNLIESIQVIDGLNLVRMEITSTFNPAGCVNITFLDFLLDAEGRSQAEQRLILDAFNMALITKRTVHFLIVDDSCSTVATSSTIRIAVGIRIFN